MARKNKEIKKQDTVKKNVQEELLVPEKAHSNAPFDQFEQSLQHPFGSAFYSHCKFCLQIADNPKYVGIIRINN